MPIDEVATATLHQQRFHDDATGIAFTLVVVEGEDIGQSFSVRADGPGRVLIGSSETCAIRLRDALVSRRHAALDPVGSRLRVTDLGSTNGTCVNGVSIVDAFVEPSHLLALGATTLRVVAAGREGIAPPAHKSFGNVIGESAAMRRLYPLCERLAASDVPVILEGETGTGKEALAEALHERGPRAAGPFVVFDCTAVPPNLVEGELFGHERGAFTGAVGSRKGVFEQAAGGTLLIDEIGDMDISLQPKLLRAIERSEVRRLGGATPIRVNVRVLAATRRNLDREVQAGRFRDDLFHRLAVARIELPPLRDRKEDIEPLARHFFERFAGQGASPSSDLVARWIDYDWPGNVRELRNAVARQVALGDLADAEMTHSSPRPKSEDVVARLLDQELPLTLARAQVVEDFEQRYVERMLERHGGNVVHAARAAGIARRYFQKLKARQGK